MKPRDDEPQMDLRDIPEESVFYMDEDEEPAEKPKKKKSAKKKKKKKKKQHHKKNGPLAMVAFIFILVILMFVFGWVGYVSAYIYPLVFGNPGDGDDTVITEEQQQAFASGQMVVMMLGSDHREGSTVKSRSDTLMVAFVDLDERSIRLLSIPRDTYITIPTTGERTKINHAYAYGGVDLMKQTIESNFNIYPDYYLDINFQGFIDIVDTIGGITVDIPEDMVYKAEAKFPEDNINLSAGVQTLDGLSALQYCRFRNDARGDLGRIDRQQAFLVALKEKMFSAGTLLKIPDLCSVVMENMETDFAGTQMLKIMLQLKNGVDFQTYQPENTPKYIDEISYVFITEKGQTLIDALCAFGEIPEGIEATTDKMDITPGASTSTEGEAATGEDVDDESTGGDATDATQP